MVEYHVLKYLDTHTKREHWFNDETDLGCRHDDYWKIKGNFYWKFWFPTGKTVNAIRIKVEKTKAHLVFVKPRSFEYDKNIYIIEDEILVSETKTKGYIPVDKWERLKQEATEVSVYIIEFLEDVARCQDEVLGASMHRDIERFKENMEKRYPFK
jgi:hypothetical protein